MYRVRNVQNGICTEWEIYRTGNVQSERNTEQDVYIAKSTQNNKRTHSENYKEQEIYRVINIQNGKYPKWKVYRGRYTEWEMYRVGNKQKENVQNVRWEKELNCTIFLKTSDIYECSELIYDGSGDKNLSKFYW